MYRFYILAGIVAMFASVFASSCSDSEDHEQKEITAIASAVKQYPENSFDTISDSYGNYVLRYISMPGDSTEISNSSDSIFMVYSGKALQRSLVFAKNDSLRTRLGSLTSGLKVGLTGVRRKSSLVLIVPYSQAYGSKTHGNIQPYSTLLYEIYVR